jgi:hypothetical protein
MIGFYGEQVLPALAQPAFTDFRLLRATSWARWLRCARSTDSSTTLGTRLATTPTW